MELVVATIFALQKSLRQKMIRGKTNRVFHEYENCFFMSTLRGEKCGFKLKQSVHACIKLQI